MLCGAFFFDCYAMSMPLLEDGTPIKFHYECSDIPASYEVFFAGVTTLENFYIETHLLGVACRDLRVRIPGSEYCFNTIEFFFYDSTEILYTSFCANHNTKVSSLAGEIETLIVDGVNKNGEKIFNDNFKDFILRGVQITHHDDELKKGGLRHFLEYNMQQDYSQGLLKTNGPKLEYFLQSKLPKKSDNIMEKVDNKPVQLRALMEQSSGFMAEKKKLNNKTVQMKELPKQSVNITEEKNTIDNKMALLFNVELHYGYKDLHLYSQKFYKHKTSLLEFICNASLVDRSNYGAVAFIISGADDSLIRLTFSSMGFSQRVYIAMLDSTKISPFIQEICNELSVVNMKAPLENYFLENVELFRIKEKHKF
jgi:hypothetical protein